jgi:hypothetical protein
MISPLACPKSRAAHETSRMAKQMPIALFIEVLSQPGELGSTITVFSFRPCLRSLRRRGSGETRGIAVLSGDYAELASRVKESLFFEPRSFGS